MTTIRLDTKVLDAMIDTLDTDVDGAMERLAYVVDGNAIMMAPVDTGALKNSIHVEKLGQGKYRVTDGVEYGIWQELKGTPFMVPASEAAAAQVEQLIKQSGVFE